jgi:hypothetical protein
MRRVGEPAVVMGRLSSIHKLGFGNRGFSTIARCCSGLRV